MDFVQLGEATIFKHNYSFGLYLAKAFILNAKLEVGDRVKLGIDSNGRFLIVPVAKDKTASDAEEKIQ